MTRPAQFSITNLLLSATIIIGFQNCTQQNFGQQSQTTSESKSGGNYDGKIYLYNDSENPCGKGDVTIARITVDKNQFLLQKDACVELKTPRVIPDAQLSKNSDYIIYQGQTFGNFTDEIKPKLICDSTGNASAGAESEHVTIVIKEENGAFSAKSIEYKKVNGTDVQTVTAYAEVREIATRVNFLPEFEGTSVSGKSFQIYSRYTSPQTYPDGQSNSKIAISSGSKSFVKYGLCRQQ